MRRILFLLISLLLMMTSRSHALEKIVNPVSHEATAAARRFLQSLSEDQRKQAQHPFDARARTDMSYFPGSRSGLALNAMSEHQEKLARELLRSALSESGTLKAKTIMTLDKVLREMGEGSYYDAKRYYFAVFGEPEKFPWGWRVEGHHLSVNLTFTESGVAETPSFFGADPAIVRDADRVKYRPLEPEEELARQLIKSFDTEKRKVAIISSRAPRDIITGTKERVFRDRPVGLSRAQMTSDQQELLIRLIKEYVDRYRPELADDDWIAMKKAGFDNIHFAWAGGLEPGQGHYYRIQGPTFLMEYDNTQDKANHIHTVWRNFDGDYGFDALRDHYLKTPHD